MEFILIAILISLVLYFLPTIVASNRGHQSSGAIFFLNLFLGWTLFGWVAAFIWSFTDSAQVVVNNQLAESTVDELHKLAGLKERGFLTDEEFNKKKQQLLESA